MHIFKSKLLLYITCFLCTWSVKIIAQQPCFAPEIVIYGDIQINSDIENRSINIHRIQRDYMTVTVNLQSLRELSRTLLVEPVSQGYYYPSLTLQTINPETQDSLLLLNPSFLLSWGNPTVIDTIIFEGLQKSKPGFLRRELKGFKGQRLRPSTFSRMKGTLARYTFISIPSEGEVVQTRSSQIAYLLKLVENPDGEFFGAIGYVPTTLLRKAYFTGEVRLRLLNLLGSGCQLMIHWSKINQYSQQLQIQYYEPWLWKWPYFTELEFQQVLRDTAVVNREFNGTLGRRLSPNLNFALKLNLDGSIPTPSGKELYELTRINSNSLGLQFNYDGRDNHNNPRRGFQLGTEILVGQRYSRILKDVLQFSFKVDTEIAWNPSTQIVLASLTHLRLKKLYGTTVTFSELFWFGGAKSLRGYPQDFFSGDRVGWQSIELRWLIGEFSRIYSFYDIGFFHNPIQKNNYYQYPNAFGIGLRLNSRMGIIGLDYGFGKGDTFSTAKIHIYLENRF